MPFPSSYDSFPGTATQGTSQQSDPTVDHALQHRVLGSAVGSIERTIGTNSGTQVLMNFAAGDFAARINSGGTLQQVVTGTIGTPSLTLGSDAQGDIFYRSSAGTLARLAPGASGQYLQTQGAGANPQWTAGPDGWNAFGATLTYSSTDGHTFVVSTSADLTATIGPGDRVKMTNQSATQYFIVTAITASTMTLYGGTTYTLTNTAITNPNYSHMKAPFGFPLDPTTWTEQVIDTSLRTQASPTATTWYNLNAAHTLAIPIGIWNVEYEACLEVDRSSGNAEAKITLSTANNSESDTQMTCYTTVNAVSEHQISLYRRKILNLASKTSYYLNVMAPVASINTIGLYGSQSSTIIRAICAYL